MSFRQSTYWLVSMFVLLVITNVGWMVRARTAPAQRVVPTKLQTGTKVEGIQVADLEGKSRLLRDTYIALIYSPTCKPCMQNIDIYREIAGQAKIQAVYLSTLGKEITKEHAVRAGIADATLLLSESVGRNLGIAGTPTTIYVKDGVVHFAYTGVLQDDAIKLLRSWSTGS